MEEVNTEDVIVEYLIIYLEQKGLRLSDKFKPSNNVATAAKTVKISRSLIEISNDLKEFIDRSHNERFMQMMESVNNKNLQYDDFKTLADELFSEGTSWFKIVTFLVFGGELATKALTNDKHEKIVYKICESLCKYIDENLLQWINEQDEGWMNVRSFAGENNKRYDHSHINKSMRHYFRMATCAAFIGGLYLCSKFILQK